MDIEKLKENKFFDKLLIVRAESNLQYMIDQLRDCLESESIILTKEEALQLLDIFIRCISGELRFTEKNELEPIFIMMAEIRINDACDKLDALKDYIKKVNDSAYVKFSNDVLNKILDNIEIVYKEYSIFINELLDTMHKMYTSVNVDHNLNSFTGNLRNKNNKRLSVMYTTPPYGLDTMVYIIQSNIISHAVSQDSIQLVGNSFEQDDTFKKYIEKINTKNKTL